jgi:putative inorganic carbon (HCO3(-)) transporter
MLTWKAENPTARARLKGAACWIAEHELWLLAPAVPPLMLPEVLPRTTVVAGLILILFLWLVRWAARGHVTVHTPMDIPILGLVITLPISLYASVNMQLSFPKLTGVILGVAAFYSIVNTAQTRRDIWLITGLLLLGGVGISILSLVGTDWAAKFPTLASIYKHLPQLIRGVTRSPGGGFHPNEVGGTLILFIPLALSLLLAMVHSRWFLTASLSLILLITLLTFVLTQSRSAFLGLGVALIALGAIKNRWLRLIFGLIAVVSIGVIWHVGIERVGHLLLDVSEETVAVGTLTFAGRMEVWQRAVYMIQDFPYTGIGLNTFDLVANVMYPFFLIGPEAQVIHAHNNFLQVGVDLGIPGLVAYLSLLTAFVLMAWRVYRYSNDGALQALAVGLLCGMLAHQVYGLTDAITLGAKPGVVLWAMMGLMAAIDACVVSARG